MADEVKKVRKINNLRMIQAAMVGAAAEMFQHLSDGESVNHKPCKILFDSDPRFVRIETSPARNDQEVFVDLIPLTNVASLRIK